MMTLFGVDVAAAGGFGVGVGVDDCGDDGGAAVVLEMLPLMLLLLLLLNVVLPNPIPSLYVISYWVAALDSLS